MLKNKHLIGGEWVSGESTFTNELVTLEHCVSIS